MMDAFLALAGPGATFNRIFRREFGSPPAEYRRLLGRPANGAGIPEHGPTASPAPDADRSTAPVKPAHCLNWVS
jgi:hypothetical protein